MDINFGWLEDNNNLIPVSNEFLCAFDLNSWDSPPDHILNLVRSPPYNSIHVSLGDNGFNLYAVKNTGWKFNKLNNRPYQCGDDLRIVAFKKSPHIDIYGGRLKAKKYYLALRIAHDTGVYAWYFDPLEWENPYLKLRTLTTKVKEI